LKDNALYEVADMIFERQLTDNNGRCNERRAYSHPLQTLSELKNKRKPVPEKGYLSGMRKGVSMSLSAIILR
jgi:hypothetical protein